METEAVQFKPRQPGETDVQFLQRSILEHRRTHEEWAEWIRKGGDFHQSVGNLAEQEEAIARYDQMLTALAHLTTLLPANI
jgi:hypothetical protein